MTDMDLRFPVDKDVPLRATFEAFWRELRPRAPEPPLAVYLVGSGLWDLRGSQSLLFIVPEAGLTWLDAIAALGKRYGKAGVRAPILLTPEHLDKARDVFALEFFALSCHRHLLAGQDLLGGVTCLPGDLRRALEREARLLLQRSRQVYIQTGGHPKTLGAWLGDAVADWPIYLRAQAALLGRSPQGSMKELLFVLRDLYPEEHDLETIWQAHLSHRTPKGPEALRLFASWLTACERLVRSSDELGA